MTDNVVAKYKYRNHTIIVKPYAQYCEYSDSYIGEVYDKNLNKIKDDFDKAYNIEDIRNEAADFIDVILMNKTPNKKAVIVKMAVYTRLVVDTTASEDEITEMAIKKILQDPKGYMDGDNLEYIKDDKECPYNPETDKN
jgi:hypothetical protein